MKNLNDYIVEFLGFGKKKFTVKDFVKKCDKPEFKIDVSDFKSVVEHMEFRARANGYEDAMPKKDIDTIFDGYKDTEFIGIRRVTSNWKEWDKIWAKNAFYDRFNEVNWPDGDGGTSWAIDDDNHLVIYFDPVGETLPSIYISK